MKIVIIDDNKTVLLVNQLMLKKEGFIKDGDVLVTYPDIDTFYKENEKAIELIDVIICDYDLGKNTLDGLKFLKNVRENGFPGECILLTGDDSFVMKTKMQLQKNIHYILKNSEKSKSSTISQLGKIIENHRNSISN